MFVVIDMYVCALGHKSRSLPVSALGWHLHSLPRHVWASMRLILLWGAKYMVTRKGSDVSLNAWTNNLVLVLLLLLVVRVQYQPLPHPIADSKSWVCTTTSSGDDSVVPPVPLVVHVDSDVRLPVAPHAADATVCATLGTSSRQAADQQNATNNNDEEIDGDGDDGGSTNLGDN